MHALLLRARIFLGEGPIGRGKNRGDGVEHAEERGLEGGRRTGRRGRVGVSWATVVACLFALVALLASSPASAYRTASDRAAFAGSGPVAWEGPVVDFEISASVPNGVAFDAYATSVERAFAAWSVEGCGPQLLFARASVPRAVEGDGIVTVHVLSTVDWRGRGYEGSLGATTEVLYEERPGGRWAIADADIFVNGGAGWSGEGAPDLQGVLTHEVGHVIGLLHCCERGGVDGAPGCGVSAECAAALMFPEHQGAVHRALTDDERAGLCFLYPVDCPADCPGERCRFGRCLECAEDGDCGAGAVCREGACEATPVEPECEGGEDCAAHEACLSSRCVARAVTGDPCAEDRECRAGGCVDGVCLLRCGDGDACPPGSECDGGYCRSGRRDFGEPCREPAECTGAACLEGARLEVPVCTRACSGIRPCPLGWECGEVDGEQVCTPRPMRGCAVAPPQIGAARGSWWLAGFLATLFFILPLRCFRRHGRHPTRGRERRPERSER